MKESSTRLSKAKRQQLWKDYREEWNAKGEPIFTYARMVYHPDNCPACIAGVIHIHGSDEPINRHEYVEATKQWLKERTRRCAPICV